MRQKPKWKRPTPKPAIRVTMPQPRVVVVDTDLMKKVAQDVVLVMNGLEAQNNTGAF